MVWKTLGTRPPDKVAERQDPTTLDIRLKALFWIVQPALPFVRKKGWIPLLLFPSLPYPADAGRVFVGDAASAVRPYAMTAAGCHSYHNR